MWKSFFRDYFLFTRRERSGIIILFSVIFFIILISVSLPVFITRKQYSFKQFEGEIARLTVETNDSSKRKIYSRNSGRGSYDDKFPSRQEKYDPIKATVFYFDPNTISAGDWEKLGIRGKTVATIQKYLSKGGTFRKPADISKIWGLPVKDQQRLMPYVSIQKPEAIALHTNKEIYKPAGYAANTSRSIDVNLADTAAYISLPGIGSRLAQRIIAFRTRLGGFHCIDQVAETYLLPDSTFQKIKSRLIISDSAVKTININLASIDEMKAHPYLRYSLANAIFQYRQQHGKFNAVVEIKKIMLITTDVFNKISPYLSVQ